MQTVVSAIFLDKHGGGGGPSTGITDVSQAETVRVFSKVFSTNSPIGLVLRYR